MIHHMYNDIGNLHVWNDDGLLVYATETHVYVYKWEECQLRFAHADPNGAVRTLANLIFQTNKEYAS